MELLHDAYRIGRLFSGFVLGRYIHANLQITYDCNFRCMICDFWRDKERYNGKLSLDQIRVIGKKLNKLGTLVISLAGGEPLMRPDLPQIIRILNRCNHFPVLITNGWFVDEAFAKEIHRAGLREISVSVDYADPKKHDKQRGIAGAWDRAINALEILNRLRPTRRHRVHMISVLMDDNLEEVEPMIRICRELGVTYLLNLYSWNRGNKAGRLPGAAVSRYLFALKRRYPEFVTMSAYIEKFDTAISDGGIGNCMAGRLLMNIDPRGNVARCTETLDEPVGNILSEDIFALCRKLYRVQENSDCRQCWTSCRGFAECMAHRPGFREFKEFVVANRPYAGKLKSSI
jgi:radical SAM protein with 4Fe4S-binding SPASM domain